MNMLIEELQMLSADPRSWIVVGFMALIATISVLARYRCPKVRGVHEPSNEEIRQARETGFRSGWRFGLMMVVGVGLTLTGLFMIAGGVRPTLALGAMVLGILVIQTEPARLSIRENERVVIASHGGAAATIDGARDRLRSSHRALVAMNIVLLAGLVSGLMAF